MPTSLSFRRPRYGKVWEHGGTVDVVVRCENVDADADDVVVVTECAVSLSAVSTAWMRASRTIAVGTVRFTPEDAGDAGDDDGRGKVGLDEGRLTWIVPEDLPSGEYELKASVTNAKPAIEATTRVIVSERVSVTRTSASEATVRWDPRAVPADYSSDDGWKLAVDVVPVIGEGEDVSAVVSQVFILAAESGSKTHTKDGVRILCDVSDAEREACRKRIHLPPNREYQIRLCSFGDESIGMPDYVTAVANVDMSQTRLEIQASGHPSQATSCRSVRIADGFYARPPRAMADKHAAGEELRDMTNIVDSNSIGASTSGLGDWNVAETNDGWRVEAGINVVVIRAQDFTPIFESTWDTSGGARRSKEVESSLQSFMKAFFDGGSVDVARKSVAEHFLIISTSGQWSGSATKIGVKIAKALQLVLVGVLGADKANPSVSAEIQRALANPDKPLGLAALSHGSANDEVHTWVHVSAAKEKAVISSCLSNVQGIWYPTLVRCGSDEDAKDWSIPWQSYGREGWSVFSEEQRVMRYAQLIADVRGMIFDSGTKSRTSVYHLVRALMKYATRRSGDKSLVRTINMLLVEIILSRGPLAAAECVNAGALEYLTERVMSVIEEDGSHSKFEVLEKANIKSFLKLLSVNNFSLYAEGIRRGALEALLRVIDVYWSGSSSSFDGKTKDMIVRLTEHVALTDLSVCRMLARSGELTSAFAALRSGLTCSNSLNEKISGKIHILDITLADSKDGLVELPKKARVGDDTSTSLNPTEQLLQAYDEIWEGSGSPEKNADKDWTMLEPELENADPDTPPVHKEVSTPDVSARRESLSGDAPEPQELFEGAVLLCAMDNDWETFVAMLRQAPRLVWCARDRGARAVVFVWPKRLHSSVPVQPLLSSPNFDNVTDIPSFIVDYASVSRAMLRSDDSELVIEKENMKIRGTAEILAERIGSKLLAACTDRPPHMTQTIEAPIAGRFRGRFKASDAHTLLPVEDSDLPATPMTPSAESGFAALIRRVTFSSGDAGVQEGGSDAEGASPKTSDASDLQRLKEKVAAPQMDENSHLDAWRSASLEGGASHWTQSMRIVAALGSHGLPILNDAYKEYHRANESRPVRVLSLDGGGMRGIGTLVMLERILKESNSWCVGDCFDLVVGTSTGGLIAVGAGLLRMTIDELHELYTSMGQEIFPRKQDSSFLTRVYDSTKIYNRGREEAKNFEVMLRKALNEEADKPLYAVASHPRWYASKSPPPHVCLVSHLVSRAPATTFLMRSYQEDGRVRGHLGHLPGEHRASLIDSVRATTAAPWFLEELRVKKEIGGTGGYAHDKKNDSAEQSGGNTESNDLSASMTESQDVAVSRDPTRDCSDAPTSVDAEIRLIDGAIASNNPTAVAVFEARRLFPKSRSLCVVSLGTGAAVPKIRDPHSSSFPGWLDNTIHASCDVNQVDATIRHLLGTDDSYYRFQPTADVFGCELDDTTPETASKLKEGAASYMDGMRRHVRALADVLRPDRHHHRSESSSASAEA